MDSYGGRDWWWEKPSLNMGASVGLGGKYGGSTGAGI